MSEVKGTFAIDMLGQKYTVGDTVVYATTYFSSPVMKVATVEDVILVEDGGEGYYRIGVREIRNSHNIPINESRVTYPTTVNIIKCRPELAS